MDFLPLFLQVKNQRCLVVGGGDVALRKIRLLVSAGAIVRVVAPCINQDIQDFIAGNAFGSRSHQLLTKPFAPADLKDVSLVIAATDKKAVNQQVADSARTQNLFVNVVDDAEIGNAIMPAIIDRSPVMVAFSTGGKAPVLARLLREKLEALLPQGLGRLAQLAGDCRHLVKAKFSKINDRRYFWEKVLQGDVAEQALAGNIKQAKNLLIQQLNETAEQKTGEVYLVGGGPGDPDLLTFKALRLMQQADVVLHDRLVSDDVLALCRRDADYIYVGKKRNSHTRTQEEINALLVNLAKQGKRVLRLKGGDPFIFGRGGEEIESLSDEGIPFQVVPGITAASGCASYAGIPLTHRDHAQSVRFITGHLKNGSYALNWQEMLDPGQTLVFYMGLMGLSQICQKLVEHGRDPHTPIALIQKGTTPEQRIFIGTLANFAKTIEQEQVKAPTLIIVGTVVNLHKKLNWFVPG
ncbi:siroheme synthase CysG [Endozoicomonas sp.]|uniref:siroheme synthase CysG n=1 Tax=Endozoicomonas sp. TaxID=1892382 RepID=UPI00383AC859